MCGWCIDRAFTQLEARCAAQKWPSSSFWQDRASALTLGTRHWLTAGQDGPYTEPWHVLLSCPFNETSHGHCLLKRPCIDHVCPLHKWMGLSPCGTPVNSLPAFSFPLAASLPPPPPCPAGCACSEVTSSRFKPTRILTSWELLLLFCFFLHMHRCLSPSPFSPSR